MDLSVEQSGMEIGTGAPSSGEEIEVIVEVFVASEDEEGEKEDEDDEDDEDDKEEEEP